MLFLMLLITMVPNSYSGACAIAYRLVNLHIFPHLSLPYNKQPVSIQINHRLQYEHYPRIRAAIQSRAQKGCQYMYETGSKRQLLGQAFPNKQNFNLCLATRCREAQVKYDSRWICGRIRVIKAKKIPRVQPGGIPEHRCKLPQTTVWTQAGSWSMVYSSEPRTQYQTC